MNIFIKLLLLLLILACSAPFFIKRPGGEPLIMLNKLKLPKLSIPSFGLSKNKTAQATTQKGIKVFKWKDKNGVIHYSDKQDVNKKAKLTQINKISILPSTSKSEPVNSTSTSFPSLTTVPLSDIPKLINDAKQVEQLDEAAIAEKRATTPINKV